MKRLLLFLLILPSLAWAQPSSSSGSTRAAQEYANALTAASRFGVPRYTTALIPACTTANKGALVFDTTVGALTVCNGTTWGTSMAGGLVTGGNLELRDITDLAAESLTNPNLTGGTSWTQTGDFALAADAATYTHSAASGTFQQTSAAGAIPWATFGGNAWYVFTYTTSTVAGTPVCTIPATFALTAVSLSTAAGTYSVSFQAMPATVGAFSVACTSGVGTTITFDTLSLKRVIGGDLIVNGQVLANPGSSTAPGFSFLNQASGLYWDATGGGRVHMSINGNDVQNWVATLTKIVGDVAPNTTDTYKLGSPSNSWLWAEVDVTRSIQGSKSKALTEGAATTFVTVACPQTASANFCAGKVIYTVYETDATDMSTIQGAAQFNCINKAGTETCAAIADVQTASLVTGAGDTLACTITAVTGLTDVIGLAASCTDTSTMTQTVLNINYRLDMPQVNTIVPQ